MGIAVLCAAGAGTVRHFPFAYILQGILTGGLGFAFDECYLRLVLLKPRVSRPV